MTVPPHCSDRHPHHVQAAVDRFAGKVISHVLVELSTAHDVCKKNSNLFVVTHARYFARRILCKAAQDYTA